MIHLGVSNVGGAAVDSPDLTIRGARKDDVPGFDRLAFHRAFNSQVVGFFERTLR
jgi:hypothetical protein